MHTEQSIDTWEKSNRFPASGLHGSVDAKFYIFFSRKEKRVNFNVC